MGIAAAKRNGGADIAEIAAAVDRNVRVQSSPALRASSFSEVSGRAP